MAELQKHDHLTKWICAVILEYRKGAAGRRSAPHWITEVTACLEAGRLLLFAVMYLNEQAANTDDNQTELEQLRICQHGHPSFLEGKEAPSGMERLTAYRYWQR